MIGAPELSDDPRVRLQPRPDPPTRDIDASRCWPASSRPKSAADWFDVLIAVGVPCGPINTVDKGVAFAEKIGLEPIVTAGAGEKSRPTMRHPVTFSKTPASYPLAPPELDEQGAEIRAWLSAPAATEG